ncbi:uncharacterized protein LOC123537929 isoform X2 [Mercenaria mercenaria]|uniref:uncharacterized protein LOC123537929 isoform X2 n=1 Tax=Mercenaria mercenaria TaxID=6596 RepID=UPI00234F0A95|nr:uncharacterized protein LOC123537929 isoform X2 [Mercenaria mercenaria]
MDLICCVLIILPYITEVYARHWCEVYDPDSLEPLPEKIWCDTGCCGSRNDTHCCSVKSEFAIVEGVLGALGGFFLLLAIVITACCCRSYYRKTRSHEITTIPVGTEIVTVTLAWDCSDYEERKLHPWCEHGCCFDKNPVRCCTYVESVGTVIWTLVGLGSGFFVLSCVVGIVCCFRKKGGYEGQIISTNGGQRQGANSSLNLSGQLNRNFGTHSSLDPSRQHRSNSFLFVPRQHNSGNRINRTSESHQGRQGHIWTTAIGTNTPNNSNRHPRVVNIRNDTSFHMQTDFGNNRNNLHTRSATVETNLNTNSAQQQSSTQTDAQKYADPPPSYESLFKLNK